MRTQLYSAGVFLLTSCLSCFVSVADETPFVEDIAEQSVSVRCHGRLRDGIVAVGGETTGTTVTFHRVTWELQLPDEASREFAKRHHGESVVVAGKLRKVVGTEVAVRWIVDVSKLTAHDSRERPEEGARMTIQGTIRAALSLTGDTPDLSVRTDNQIWRLDFAANRETQTAAAALIGQPALLIGTVKPPLQEADLRTAKSPSSATPWIRVISVEAIPPTAPGTRFFTP